MLADMAVAVRAVEFAGRRGVERALDQVLHTVDGMVECAQQVVAVAGVLAMVAVVQWPSRLPRRAIGEAAAE